MDKGQDHPMLRLLKIYTKDLSFENPNAPQVFLKQDQKYKVDFNLELENRQIDEDHWEISILIYTEVVDADDEDLTLFIIELEHAGVFLVKNIPEEHMERVMAVDAPTMLFPFTRQLVSQTSVDGGFLPFLLEPINFMGFYEGARSKDKKETIQ